jgi:hypothetical protein
MHTIIKRYVLGRQSYAIEDGELVPTFDKEIEKPLHLDDPKEVAAKVVEIVADNPGVIYNIQDLVSQKGILVAWEEDDTRESVRSAIVEALEALDAEHQAQASA